MLGTAQLRVRNRGTVSARNVEVAAFAPTELKPLRAAGPAEGRIDNGGKVAFPVLDELRPGQTATYTIE